MLVRTRAEVREAVGQASATTTALVPTMGALHEGHLSLVDRARAHADYVVLSIFVNPLQFGPGEDFERYPRDLERDVRLAHERGVDLVFAPTDAELYPDGPPRVQVWPGPMADGLCGAHRPGHFQGVLTVVAKLLNIVRPDVAVFGQKDYQQAVLIRRMVEDLDLGVRIEIAPIVREPDGLAMSSRNTYLDAEERARAVALHRGLDAAARAFTAGERAASRLRETALATIAAEPGVRVQYVDLVDPATLEPLDRAEPGAVLAVAAFVGGTRLIDNVILE